MKTKSLKKQILKRLMEMEGQWIHKGRIEERVKEWGYLADTGDRTLRKLAEKGEIERKEERGSVLYRYNSQKSIYKKVVYNIPELNKQITIYK